MARAGGWERAVLHGHVPEHPTPQAAGTEYFSLDVEDVLAAGSRPDRLSAVSGPQARVQRRTVQQIVDTVPLLPTLDVPAPQRVDQLVDVLKQFNFLVPEQVIAVPKIPCVRTMRRFVDLLRQPQTAEQLVEVPTIIPFSSLQRNVEQNVGIPVVRGSGAGGGLSGFLPGQNYSMTAEQIVDNPAPRPGAAGGLQGFRRGQGSTAFPEQIPEFPDPGGGRQDFQPVQGSAVSSSDSPGQAGEWVFSTFPWKKKVQRSRAPRGRNWVPSRAHGRCELSWGLFGGTTWCAASSPCC